jgi:hypothetical protein
MPKMVTAWEESFRVTGKKPIINFIKNKPINPP